MPYCGERRGGERMRREERGGGRGGEKGGERTAVRS